MMACHGLRIGDGEDPVFYSTGSDVTTGNAESPIDNLFSKHTGLADVCAYRTHAGKNLKQHLIE